MRRTALLLSGALLISGCAPVTTEQGRYAGLYDGRSSLPFATTMPTRTPLAAEHRGNEAFRAGDLDKALFEYVRALNMNDRNGGLFLKVGLIHLKRNRHHLAEEAFRSALDRDGTLLLAREELGLLLLRRRAYAEAEAMLQQVLWNDAERWRAHNGLGVLADLRGRHAEAEVHYHAALRISPDNTKVLNNLGYSHYLVERFDDALVAFHRAVRNDPDNRRAWRNIGLLQIRQGDLVAALEALEITMERSAALNTAGALLMESGDAGRARKLFQEAIREHPTWYAEAQRNLERAILRADAPELQ